MEQEIWREMKGGGGGLMEGRRKSRAAENELVRRLRANGGSDSHID